MPTMDSVQDLAGRISRLMRVMGPDLPAEIAAKDKELSEAAWRRVHKLLAPGTPRGLYQVFRVLTVQDDAKASAIVCLTPLDQADRAAWIVLCLLRDEQIIKMLGGKS